MRNDNSSDLDPLDEALHKARVLSADPVRDARVDDEQWDALSRRLDLHERHTRGRRRPTPSRVRTLLAAGAFVAAAAVAAVFFVGRRAPEAGHPATTTYATRAGQRASVNLANGARVVLGPLSTLTVDRDRGRDRVHVDGEVMFTVRHDEATPFVVTVGRAEVRVLGTTFIVRKYPGDHAARVIVSEGRVAVQSSHTVQNAHGSAHAVLSANMLGVIGDSGDIRVMPDVKANDVSALASGRLVFRNTLARDVIPELNRAYDVDIRLADSVLGRQSLTLVVPVDTEPLKDVLDALLITLDAHATRTGRIITIAPGRQAKLPRNLQDRQEKQYGR